MEYSNLSFSKLFFYNKAKRLMCYEDFVKFLKENKAYIRNSGYASDDEIDV